MQSKETFLIPTQARPWIKPAAYISLATISCFLFTAFVPPLLDPAMAARIPVLGGLPGDLPGYWIRFVLSFSLLGLAPLVLSLIFGDKPSTLGVNFRTPLLRKPLFWLLVPVAIVFGAVGAASPDLGNFYPYSRDLIGRVRAEGMLPFVGHFAAYFFLYYVPWEFFFRGFLLLGLAAGAERAMAGPDGKQGTTVEGLAPALVAALVLFQTMPSTMLHVGHPLSELFGAVIAGIGFGILAWKTRSIIPGLILHGCLGLGTDAFIVLKGAGIL